MGVACPREIKEFGSVREWFLKEGHMIGSRRQMFLIREICRRHFKNRCRSDDFSFYNAWEIYHESYVVKHDAIKEVVNRNGSIALILMDIHECFSKIEKSLANVIDEHEIRAEIMSLYLAPLKSSRNKSRHTVFGLMAFAFLLLILPSLCSVGQVSLAIVRMYAM